MTNISDQSSKNALDILKDDHAIILELFQKYNRVNNDDDKERLSFEIQDLLRIHIRLEEEIFYPAMRISAVEEEERLLEDCQKDHQTISSTIDLLEVSHISDDSYNQQMEMLERVVDQHIQREEEELFTDAEDKLGDELNRLGQDMGQLRKELELP